VNARRLRALQWIIALGVFLGLGAIFGFGGGGDDLYVAGGYTAASGLAAETNALWRYEPGADRWTKLRGAPTARGAIAAATVNGRIVVVGGEQTAGTIAEVESFDPRTRRWRSEPRLKTPRHGLGAISHRGRSSCCRVARRLARTTPT